MAVAAVAVGSTVAAVTAAAAGSTAINELFCTATDFRHDRVAGISVAVFALPILIELN
jgi:hypothetical protein